MSLVFKLHFTMTANILIIFSVIVSAIHLSNSAMNCNVSGSGFDKSFIEANCARNSYIYESATRKKVGVEVEYAGIGRPEPGEKPIYQTHYNQIHIYMFFQALCFIMIKVISNSLENGRLSTLIDFFSGFNDSNLFRRRDSYFISHEHFYDQLKSDALSYRLFVLEFFVSIFLNLANLLLQIYTTDLYLNGKFINYGLDLIGTAWFGWPEVLRFPSRIMCDFNYSGGQNTIDNASFLCISNLNVTYSSIFQFLWFWYFGLITITIIYFVYQLLVLAYCVLFYRSRFHVIFILKRMKNCVCNQAHDQLLISFRNMLNDQKV